MLTTTLGLVAQSERERIPPHELLIRGHTGGRHCITLHHRHVQAMLA